MSGNDSDVTFPSPEYPRITIKVTINPWVSETLNKSEYAVLEFLLVGINVKTISDIQQRSIKTISSQKMSVYRKLSIISDMTLYRDLLERNAIVLSK